MNNSWRIKQFILSKSNFHKQNEIFLKNSEDYLSPLGNSFVSLFPVLFSHLPVRVNTVVCK